MNFYKISAGILLFFISCFSASAQVDQDYKAGWTKIDQLEKKGLTRDALKETLKIFDAAIKSNNQAQQIKAAMYQMKYRNLVEEDNRENNIFYLDTLIAKTKTPVQNILLSMQADLFKNYRQRNQYRLYSRTQLADEKSKDITTWSISKLNNTIAKLYRASLQNEAILKAHKLNGLDAIIQKGQNSRQLRPTLFDFLSFRALEYFMNDENDVTQPANKFIINDPRSFADIKTFIQTRFETKDSSSLQYNALLILQKILQFHINDNVKDALLDADLIRLAFVNEHGVFSNKNKLYEEALLKFESDYSTSPFATQAMYLRAQEHYDKGNNFNPFNNTAVQFEIKKAADICEKAIQLFPKSGGASLCKNLLLQIRQPYLRMETEKVNIPNEAFRTLVSYKNTGTVYLRIIKTNREELKKIALSGYDNEWPAIVKLTPFKSWTIPLPELKDFQEHSAEIKIDPLPQGTYMILASLNADFTLNNNIIARQVTYTSNISYINNNRNELYVLNRSNGQPLANAEVQLWDHQYDYGSRRNISIKKEKYNTDKNGFVKIELPQNRYSNFLQIKYNNDELFTDDNYNTYGYNSYRREDQKRSFLFTDRSIYRPGQTLFFKGIVVSTDTTGRKSKIINGLKTSILLFDANGQKLSSIPLTSNEYGSFNGSFTLPAGTLNGNFSIRDSVTQSYQQFSVEEYKRPKFLAEIQKPTGTYRINDTINITGNAKAYAGNAVDGAAVSYRVVRRVQYPIWWGYSYGKIWPPMGNKEDMEITNGFTTTDANGNFIIQFKAIPDETVDKKTQPIFHYEINADITDINGETRSAATKVAVAYQALQLNIVAGDKLLADSFKNIKITSTNLNGLFDKAVVNFSMFKLAEPNRIFRERYWQQPDLFIMSKADYYNAFPYDLYADEDQPGKWQMGKKEMDKNDSTTADGNWALNDIKPAPGLYKLMVTTKDKYGEEVKAEKYIRIIDDKFSATNEPLLISVNKEFAAPGEKIIVQTQTGFDKMWLIRNLNKNDETIYTSFSPVSNRSFETYELTVTENDRGGINMNVVFVMHNRFYSQNKFINIPWSNKDLQISYETFRDKILPGSEEKWTLTIKGNKGQQKAAEMLVSMYDASLDQFRPHTWTSLKSLWPVNNKTVSWLQSNFRSVTSNERNYFVLNYEQPLQKTYDALVNNGWNEYGSYYLSRNMELAAASPMADAEMSLTKNKEEETSKKTFSVSAKTITVQNSQPDIPAPVTNNNIQIRKNFNETAFFFPQLTTDTDGNISFNFTIPEALTQWKLMSMAHDKELASAYLEKTVITQKPLMVQPNIPRFLREGDGMELVTKVVNMSDKEITGIVQLELLDALTNNPVDGWFKNIFPTQYFTAEAGQSVAVKFPMEVPFNFNSALIYRFKAISKDDLFSDGEEAAIPVLSNRMLVTETMPLNMRNTNSKQFVIDKLLNSSPTGGSNESATLTNHALTVEYTSNPAWYAVQALPYLMEYPYECAEQNFNRYYANILAAYIANSSPRIKAVFEKWKASDTAALMSNLQKNEELKAALLQETPWVLDAKNENEQKKNIALLFDMVRLAKEKNASLLKLKEMQSSNGGFSWFKGGPDDRYITQYIITGIGHLRKLNALSKEDYASLKPIVDKALPYLDARLKDEYNNLLKYKVKLSGNNLSNTAIQYLYMRSFFPETNIAANNKIAVDYFSGQSAKFWLSQSKYMQAMIALSLHRKKDINTSKAIIKALKQNAIYKEEMGMYWKEYSTGGYYWQEAPIESQAMMIEAFTDIDGNQNTIDDLKTWLLKQKQTQNWKTTKATAEACYALLLSPPTLKGGELKPMILLEEKEVIITLGNYSISSSDESSQAGTGYFKHAIQGQKVKPDMGNISVKVNNSQASPLGGGGGSASWGAVYWQYFEDLDKITTAATPLSLVKKLFIEQNSNRGPVLKELKEGETVKVGDKIKVRIILKADRNMEYVHMKDMRAAAMEPVNVISQYKWQGGLGYYESTKDASTNFFFSNLPRGSYVFEYPLFVTHKGQFSNGITTIQCMYAPEFTSHSEGLRLNVE